MARVKLNKSETLFLRLCAAEKELIRIAAARAALSLAELTRRATLTESRRILERVDG